MLITLDNYTENELCVSITDTKLSGLHLNLSFNVVQDFIHTFNCESFETLISHSTFDNFKTKAAVIDFFKSIAKHFKSTSMDLRSFSFELRTFLVDQISHKGKLKVLFAKYAKNSIIDINIFSNIYFGLLSQLILQFNIDATTDKIDAFMTNFSII